MVQAIIFSETSPARSWSKIPGMNVMQNERVGDNNWVMMEKLPGNGTYYAATDSPTRLIFNPSTLETTGRVEYEDGLKICKMGVTHSQYLDDGSQVSICGDVNSIMQSIIYVFRIRPETPLKREIVTKIHPKHMAYEHGFALIGDDLVIFESPYYWDMMKMFFGADLNTALTADPHDTTKIHVVNAKTGKLRTYDTGKWSVVLHFGNAFEKDGKFVIDASAFDDPSKNPFSNFLFENLKEEKLLEKQIGGKYKRYEIEL